MISLSLSLLCLSWEWNERSQACNSLRGHARWVIWEWNWLPQACKTLLYVLHLLCLSGSGIASPSVAHAINRNLVGERNYPISGSRIGSQGHSIHCFCSSFPALYCGSTIASKCKLGRCESARQPTGNLKILSSFQNTSVLRCH